MHIQDTLPISSGRGHIGISEGISRGSFNFSTLRPYLVMCHMSGVYHDNYGESGVLRFDAELKRFQFSVNGGLSFTNIINPTETLQTLYNNGEVAIINSTFDNINFISQSSNVIFGTDSRRTPINISGLVAHPQTSHVLGDLTMLIHSITSGNPLHGSSSSAIARSRSLGVGTLLLNTGSGIVNISIGSGIAQFRSSIAVTVDTSTSGVAVPMSLQDFSDLNYVAGNAGGVGHVPPPRTFIVLSPGLYRISYNITLDRTSGNNPRTIKTYVRRNLHESLSNGISYTFHRDTTDGENTAHGSFLTEANAGDFFTIYCQYASTTTASTIVTLPNDCWCVVEKIGARRHESRISGI